MHVCGDRTGTRKLPDGNVYEGQYVNNVRSGEGIMTYANGDVYEGAWAKDHPNGVGKLVSKGSLAFLLPCYPVVFSILSVTNQFLLLTITLNPCVHTYVINTIINNNFCSGNTYVGEFKNGKFDGVGKYTYRSDPSNEEEDFNLYEGEFAAGKFDGKGECNYADGSTYRGYFSEGMREGKGALKLANGDMYSGDWVNDKYQGHGILHYASGGEYEGMFSHGMKHGKGMFKYGDGTVDKGYWSDDKRVAKPTKEMIEAAAAAAPLTNKDASWLSGLF